MNNQALRNDIEQIFCVCEWDDLLLKSMKGFIRLNSGIHLYTKSLGQDVSLGSGPVCVVSLKYKKKKWEPIEKSSLSLNLNAIRAAIESQFPNIYNLLQERHAKLKSIYAHCKKGHYAIKQKFIPSKIGRNDPCPCGSGMKYKKCCLAKPQ